MIAWIYIYIDLCQVIQIRLVYSCISPIQVISFKALLWPASEILSSKPTILTSFIDFFLTYSFHSHPIFQNFVDSLTTYFLPGHFGIRFSLVPWQLTSFLVISASDFRWSSDDLLLAWSFRHPIFVGPQMTCFLHGHSIPLFSWTPWWLTSRIVIFHLSRMPLHSCCGMRARCSLLQQTYSSCIWSHPRGAFLCNRNITE